MDGPICYDWFCHSLVCPQARMTCKKRYVEYPNIIQNEPQIISEGVFKFLHRFKFMCYFLCHCIDWSPISYWTGVIEIWDEQPTVAMYCHMSMIFFLIFFFYFHKSGVREAKCPVSGQSRFWKFARLPERTWCPVELTGIYRNVFTIVSFVTEATQFCVMAGSTLI